MILGPTTDTVSSHGKVIRIDKFYQVLLIWMHIRNLWLKNKCLHLIWVYEKWKYENLTAWHGRCTEFSPREGEGWGRSGSGMGSSLDIRQTWVNVNKTGGSWGVVRPGQEGRCPPALKPPMLHDHYKICIDTSSFKFCNYNVVILIQITILVSHWTTHLCTA